MKEHMSFGELLDSSIENEHQAMLFYQDLVNLFPEEDAVSKIWLKLAEDERDHSEQIMEIKECMEPNDLNENVSSDLLEMFNSIKIIDHMKLECIINNLNDAYDLAHELECSEINNLFKILTKTYVGEEHRKQFILSQLNNHIVTLERIKEIYPTAKQRTDVVAKRF